jgi:hypothetical protein
MVAHCNKIIYGHELYIGYLYYFIIYNRSLKLLPNDTFILVDKTIALAQYHISLKS